MGHLIAGYWYIFCRFVDLELIFPESWSFINPDGKAQNILRLLGLSPPRYGINARVVCCYVIHDFLNGQRVDDLKTYLNVEVINHVPFTGLADDKLDFSKIYKS